MNPYIQYMYSYPHKTAYGALEGVDFRDYAHRLSGSHTGLYFHIPFCESKCGYCNLFSVAGQKEEFMGKYVDAMERHAAQIRACLPDDVFFSDLTLGGGTPLLLSAAQLERVFRTAEKFPGLEERTRPVHVETSPAQTTEEKLSLLKEHHVTRISMGVQSFQEEELRTLGRRHTAEMAERAMARIKKTGFPCVNLDLIYGIPGQTMQTLRDSAERALAYEPEELFIYPLYIKKGTDLYRKGVQRPEQTYDMYVQIRSFLKEHGYFPYSMRRFVKKEKAADGDRKSCGFENTISIGCGGRSYIGNLHFCTPYYVRQQDCRKVLESYTNCENYLPVKHGYLLSEEEQRRRYVIKNILFCCGLSRGEYREMFSGEVGEDFPVLRDWIQSGYAYEEQENIYLTEKGMSLSDALGPMLISEEVREKMRRENDSTDLLPGKSEFL